MRQKAIWVARLKPVWVLRSCRRLALHGVGWRSALATVLVGLLLALSLVLSQPLPLQAADRSLADAVVDRRPPH